LAEAERLVKRFLGGCKVIGNDEIGQQIYLMELECEEIAVQAEPGQFVHIRVGDSFEPLLRRPFSVHDVEGSSFKVVYEVVGRGTKILSETGIGREVDVFGPLGRGFELEEGSKNLCIVAGGMGIAPFRLLARKLRSGDSRVLAFVGAGDHRKLVGDSSLRSMGIEVFTATEDGSLGFHGFVTDLLVKVLDRRRLKDVALYACGPKGMLKSLAEIAFRRNLKAQASLEEFMACGVGACLGCAVRLQDGKYGMVCKDGPVFFLNEVVFDG
jgi:dihydroorotate dehydrogenase electron transfer subunit